MFTELKDVEKLLQEWEVVLEAARKKGEGLFGDPAYNNLLNLFKHLSINSSMSVEELETALQTLENIAVTKANVSRPIPFYQSLEEHHYRSFKKHYESAKRPTSTPLVVADNSPLHQFLIKNQQMLLNYIERSHLHAIGDVPLSEVNYTAAQLRESQVFFELETTSQAKTLPDNATILSDLSRGGITLNHTKVKPETPKNEILQALEDFTGDEASQPNSRANKILNFGGQFLEGVILQEFTNSTVFSDSHISGIEQGNVKGHIDWSKDDQGNFHATVKIKILTCSFADPDDLFAPQKIYAMASDGSSLIEIGMDDPELIDKIFKRCRQEMRGETENNVVPICEINAKIKLAPNKVTKGYLLQIEEFQTQYNTSDLISTKAPEYREPNRLSL